jgi:UDP-glucose-4-epimerase GalE
MAESDPSAARPTAPFEVLVTGGCGYIGSHIVRELCASGFLVCVLDNLTTGHVESLSSTCDFSFYQADLRDGHELESCFRQHHFRCVIHCGGLALMGESIRDPENYYGANLIGGLHLLALCKRYEVEHFVFSSTCSVYGVPERVPITEDHPLRPLNAYGRTKLAFEHALASYREAHSLNYVALRYFNAAGAHPSGDLGEDHEPETHLIPNALRVALGQIEFLTVHGRDYPTPDGTGVRDYVHVVDIAQAHVAALRHLTKGGESGVVNLGTGQGHSVVEVLKACEAACGRPIRTVDGPHRPGDVPVLVADNARARELLGFTTQHSDLATICADAWRWSSRHPHGYRS